MGDDSYNLHVMNPDVSWVCQTCRAPNHSVSMPGNNLATFASYNSFSSLSDSTSRPSELSAEHSTSSHKNLCNATMNVLNINARSIKAQDKRDQFYDMLDQWLTPEVYDTEIIPGSLSYTMFRRNRGSRGGGVFILVRDLYTANRVLEFETNCEILWINLQLAGSFTIHISVYYKPNESDTLSFDEFKQSVQMVSTVKGHTWNWEILTTPNVTGQIIFPPFPLTVRTGASMRSSLTS